MNENTGKLSKKKTGKNKIKILELEKNLKFKNLLVKLQNRMGEGEQNH